MTDQMIRLVEEIRDLQRQQVENSTRALQGQAEAIRQQSIAVARGRWATRVVVVIAALLVLGFLLSIAGPFLTGWEH